MLTIYKISPWTYFVHNTKLFSVNCRCLKSFYDSLGITPKATQAEVKAAYYKLSKMYHPDRNEGSQDAATKFRDITEAYEVLGNLGLRKRYDKGILPRSIPTSPSPVSQESDEPFSKFYESRQHRSKPPTVHGRAPMYNLDEWAQAHYGASVARKQAAKKEYAKQFEYSSHSERMRRKDAFAYCIALLLLAALFGSLTWEDYDNVSTTNSSSSD